MTRQALIEELRGKINGLEVQAASNGARLSFSVPELDTHLPGGGLRLCGLHEVEASETGAHGAATLFVAAICARLTGPVLWCLHSRDLFAPGLAQVGLAPERIVYAHANRESDLLFAMEEGLRHRALAGVVGELSKLSLTAGRRLQLAAESSGVVAFALRRSALSERTSEPSAALTRWRISPSPSPALHVTGVGRSVWQVALLRCRGGTPATWMMEACDAQGRLAMVSKAEHGADTSQARRAIA